MKDKLRNELIKSFKNVEEWQISKHRLFNKKRDIDLWVANGMWFLSFVEVKDILTFWDKVILWGKIKKLIREILAQKIIGKAERME